MITVLHWDATAKACRECPVDRLPPSSAEVLPEDVWWMDMTDPTQEEEDLIFGKFFQVHTLARDDTTPPRVNPDPGAHPPRVEDSPNFLFAIATPFPPGGGAAIKPPPATPPPSSASQALTRRNRPQLSAVLDDRVLVTH